MISSPRLVLLQQGYPISFLAVPCVRFWGIVSHTIKFMPVLGSSQKATAKNSQTAKNCQFADFAHMSTVFQCKKALVKMGLDSPPPTAVAFKIKCYPGSLKASHDHQGSQNDGKLTLVVLLSLCALKKLKSVDFNRNHIHNDSHHSIRVYRFDSSFQVSTCFHLWEFYINIYVIFTCHKSVS